MHAQSLSRSKSNTTYSARRRRSKRGGSIAEFGAAFLVLVVFIFIPLINACFVAVRYFIATGAITEYVHRLSLTERRSQAVSMLTSDTWWSDFSSKCGVTVTNKKLSVVICGANEGDKLTLNQIQDVPANWLPSGDKGPCVYTIQLDVDVDVAPVYAGGSGCPGITAPLPMKISAHSDWENLSRNPKTKRYFINE